jgi:hypothetical protein
MTPQVDAEPLDEAIVDIRSCVITHQFDAEAARCEPQGNGCFPPLTARHGTNLEGRVWVDSGPSNHGSKAASLHEWRSFIVSGFVGCRFILS